MFNLKTNSDFNPVIGIGHIIVNVRVTAILFALILLLPLSTYADGLFDFQMKLAKGGNAEAQYKVGEMYESGFGVKKDRAEAEKWTTKAASKGHETAGFKLLYWDVEKNGLKGENKAKVDDLVKKADNGNPQAQYFVGKMHANGVGYKKNSDKAIEWLNKAAFVGVLEAERELVVVREDKQAEALARSRAEAKKRAQLEAQQAKERQAKLEQQRKIKAKQEADVRAKAEADALKKKADQAAIAKAKKEEEARKAKLLAQKEAAAREAARQREAKKQALLKQKAEQAKQRKAQFESDPCSGKSARFLSTCK